jgi:hypothetical protein
VRRGLARTEPAVLAALGTIDEAAPGWRHARVSVAAALAAESRGGTDTVLRWLASFVLTAAEPETISRDVAVLLDGLPSENATARPA